MLNRRQMLKTLGATALVGTDLAIARAATDARLVLVVLRGAVDGLALAAPYGDGHYQRLRGALAMPEPGDEGGVLKLDGMFGLHPSLPAVYESFKANEALLVHAVASPYRARSHFDGQDMLENGASKVGEFRDGWLNRAIAALGQTSADAAAVALAQTTPLVLRGASSTTSWAPSRLPDADDNTIARLQRLYAGDEFFATRLNQALRSRDIAGHSMNGSVAARGNEARRFGELMTAAARFLSTPNGPTIAVTELGGWDTHANQGTSNGALANRMAALDTGLANLRDGLGEQWSDTVIMIVTEFGRTVRVNGTRGTDHGTGTACMLLGGAVNGGRVVSDWPGLRDSDLLSNRDLYPTTDLRSVFKSVLTDHLGISPAFVESSVFPNSRAARPLDKMIRS